MSDNSAATLLHGKVPTLLQLPPELLNLILDQANLEDLNCLRLVCKKLKKAVEKQNTLRWSCNLHWQLPTSELTELRQHLVRKLAESFLKGYDLSKVTAIMMVWAQRLEGEAFEEAASKALMATDGTDFKAGLFSCTQLNYMIQTLVQENTFIK